MTVQTLRSAMALAMGVGALAVGAPGASAATVGVVGGTLTFTAAPGETNDVAVAGTVFPTASVRVSDAGAPLTVGTGCDVVDDHTATCADLPMVIDTGDGNDRVRDEEQGTRVLTIRGGLGDDTLAAGSSQSLDVQMFGGPGNDTMSVANNGGGQPVMHGGPGDDRLTLAENEGGMLYGDDGNDQLVSRHGDWLRMPIRLDGGRGNDVYSVGWVSAGTPDLLVASPGTDTLDLSGVSFVFAPLDLSGCANCVERIVGSPLDDTINVRDGRPDVVSCGDGADAVIADRRDVVAGDCETVDRGRAS
jgi:Ca2+-binding RTX toxin-like protein